MVMEMNKNTNAKEHTNDMKIHIILIDKDKTKNKINNGE